MSVSFYLIKDGDILRLPRFTEIDGETFEENDLELNVHNGGAADIANTLGFSIDWNGGEITELATFEDHCRKTAEILRAIPELDSGRSDRISGGTSKPLVIECARPDGYLTSRIETLRKLAEVALLEDAHLVYS